MEALSFRFELGNKPTRNKKFSIYLCITVGGKRKRIKSPVEVPSRNDFNSKCIGDNWVRKSVPQSTRWNKLLHDFKEEAVSKFNELDQEEDVVTPQKLATSIKTKNVSESFIKFAKEEAQRVLNSGSIETYKKFNGFINKLEKFQEGKDLLFDDINVEYLTKFENFLHKLPNTKNHKKLLHPNTIHEVMKDFRTMINKAIKVDRFNAAKNPYMTYRIRTVETSKEKLTEKEIMAIKELDLEEGSLIWHTRNYFLFSFYCAGIRAGDLIQLRWKNIVDGRLNYQMGKNHKMRDLVLVQPALDILAYYRYGKEKIRKRDYVFPLLDPKKAYFSYVDQKDIDAMPVEIKQLLHKDVSSKNVVMNKELRRIAKLAGIDKEISMHVSRHSFAKIAKDQGTDNSAIQQMLAHSSLKVTEGYMGSFDTKSTDNALMNIFGKTVTKKDTMITEVMSLLQERDEKYVAELLAKLQSESKFHIDD